jgi:hypothetical protein
VDGAGDVYIADSGNNRAVKVTAAGVASVLSTGSLTVSSCTTPANTTVTTVLCTPYGIGVDGAGDVYIADSYNSRVVEVTAAGVASVLNTGSLLLSEPTDMKVDGAGDIYIADYGNDRVVEVTAAGVASVLNASSLPGTTDGETIYSCATTGLCRPAGVALDGAGNLYIADTYNNRAAEFATGLALSFAKTIVGQTSTDSPQTVTFENIGNETLNITALATVTTGQTSSSFNLNGSGTTCTSTTSLTSSESCGLGVEFSPLLFGPLTGAVSITDNSLNGTGTVQQFGLSGMGLVVNSIAITPVSPQIVVGGTQQFAATATFSDNSTQDVTTAATWNSSNTSVATIDTSALASASHPGSANITATWETVTSNSDTLTVGQATPTITWATPAAITYGTALSSTQLDASLSVAGSCAYTPAVGTVLAAGIQTLSVTCTPTDTTDYSSSTTTVQITVSPAVLTVTAANASRAYGAANPTFTDTIAGYVNGDTSSVVTGAASLTTTATTASPAGTYPITAAAGTLAASNYTFTFVNGALTIGQATPTISWSPVSSITYGTTLNGILNATAQFGGSAVTGTFSYTATLAGGSPVAVTSATVPVAGSYTLTATFTPTGTTAGDYQAVSSSVPLFVNLAQLTVTLTSNFNPVLVQNAITFTATVSSTAGVPTGTVTFLDGATPLGTGTVSGGLATLTTSALTVGLHSITASYGGDVNFAGATSSPLTESVEDFSMNASGATATAPPGGTAEFTFALSPIGGTTLPAAITFTVSGLPAGATYSLSPATLAAGAGTTTVTVTVNLAQTTAAAHSTGGLGRKATPFLLALLLLPFAGRLRRTGKRLSSTLPMLLLLGLSLAAAVGLSGCGSKTDFFAHSQKSYTVTVTGTSGALSHSTTVTLTVE